MERAKVRRCSLVSDFPPVSFKQHRRNLHTDRSYMGVPASGLPGASSRRHLRANQNNREGHDRVCSRASCDEPHDTKDEAPRR